MARWFATFLVSALLAAGLGLGGVPTGTSSAAWLSLLCFVLICALALIWRSPKFTVLSS